MARLKGMRQQVPAHSRETVGRVRYAVLADDSRCGPTAAPPVRACRKMDGRFVLTN